MTISGVNVRADSSTHSTILAPGRTELSGIAGQKDTHEVISWVFCLRLLWRVNCEALRIAAGQNLKRLLKKRGWGRRPFPVEALCASFLAAFGWFARPVLEYCAFFLPMSSVYLMLLKQ